MSERDLHLPWRVAANEDWPTSCLATVYNAKNVAVAWHILPDEAELIVNAVNSAARNPADGSAMRAALAEIVAFADKEKKRDWPGAVGAGILEIHDIANTALNSAPRNCDRFGNWQTAWEFWRHNVATSDDTKAENEPFTSWLFATAERKEESK